MYLKKLNCRAAFAVLLPQICLRFLKKYSKTIKLQGSVCGSIATFVLIFFMYLKKIKSQGSVCGSIATAATRPSALPAQTLNTGSMALSGNNHQHDHNHDDDDDDGNPPHCPKTERSRLFEFLDHPSSALL